MCVKQPQFSLKSLLSNFSSFLSNLEMESYIIIKVRNFSLIISTPKIGTKEMTLKGIKKQSGTIK